MRDRIGRCDGGDDDGAAGSRPPREAREAAPTPAAASPATPPLTPLTPALAPCPAGPMASPSALAALGPQPCACGPRLARGAHAPLRDQSQPPSGAAGPDPAATARARPSGSDAADADSGGHGGHGPAPSPERNRYPAAHGPYVKAPIYIDYGLNVQIGRSSFINRNCHILDSPVSALVIGERCLLGPNVHLYCVTHTLDARKRTDPSYGGSSLAGDIRIGDDCWIGVFLPPSATLARLSRRAACSRRLPRSANTSTPGGNATILPGVTIGAGACIGAGSVVTRDVPAHHLAVGAPARIIRCLHEHDAGRVCPSVDAPDCIARLLRLKTAHVPTGDVTGIKAAKARIRALEILVALMALSMLWLLFVEASRQSR